MKAKVVHVLESPESVDYTLYFVRVSRVWKGTPTDLCLVAMDYGTLAKLSAGQEYLLFGNLRQDNWPLIPRQGVDRHEKATGPTLAFVEKDGFITYDSAFDAVLGPGSRPFPLVPLTLTLVGLVLFALLVARRRYRRAKR